MRWGVSDPLAALGVALDALEADLRSGQLDFIADHQRRIEEAIFQAQNARLETSASARLADLKDKAQQTGRLMNATLDGMRGALAGLKNRQGFSSYDAKGQSGQIGARKSSFEIRR